MEVPFKAKWIPAKRNDGRLLQMPDMHTFLIRKVEKNSLFAACSQKAKTKCPCTATVNKTTEMVVSVRGEHNHDSDLLRLRTEASRQEVLARAVANPTVAPRVAFADLTKTVGNSAAVATLPKSRTFARQVQRERQKTADCPPVPESLAELEVPPHLKLTTTGERFLIIDRKHANGKVLGFCSPTGLELLRSSPTWSVDGTFNIASNTDFYQVKSLLI